jgi:hypothetical protein
MRVAGDELVLRKDGPLAMEMMGQVILIAEGEKNDPKAK